MSLTGFRGHIHEQLLQFLWRQWAQLGVAGGVAFTDRWIVDPEPLLLASLSLARFDPRLYDEIIDWAVTNERWLSVQRIKNLTREWDMRIPDPTGTRKRVIGAFAGVMHAHENRLRWKSLVANEATAEAHLPLFLGFDGSALPIWGTQDPQFVAHGLERPSLTLRGLSSRIPLDTPLCILLKLRALFGLGPRPEVVSYLLSVDAARVPAIARATSYSVPSVRDALEDLSQGDFVYGPLDGLFQLDARRWQQFLGTPAPAPAWVDWSKVFTALLLTTDTLADLDRDGVSDYIRASRLKQLSDALKVQLIQSGVPNVFLPPITLEDAEKDVLARLMAFVSLLVTGTEG